MLSTTSDYAIRATLLLARHYGAGPVPVDRIAAATGAPRNYLGKTLYALVRAGLVTSARGPTGGFALAVAPEKLTVAQVIDCFDDPHPSGHCLTGTGACDPDEPCIVHQRWTALLAARRAPLVTTTVAQLLGGGSTSNPDDVRVTDAPSPSSLTHRFADASAA